MVFSKFGLLVFCFVGLFLSSCKADFEQGNLNDVKELTSSTDPLVSAFQSLPKEEKNDFLAYCLALGIQDWAETQGRLPKFFPSQNSKSLARGLNIPEKNVEKYEKMNIPKESRKKLLEWAKKEFNLSTRNVYELVKLRDAKEITLPDIGELCCPW